MNTAEQLTAQQRRRAWFDSICSACWGALAPALLQDSAIIIIFATLLGAGDMLSMVTTSAPSVANFLLLIPAAYLAGKIGCKKTLIITASFASLMIVFLAASPWFGGWTRAVLLGSILLFSLSMTIYTSAWFPLAYGFLLKDERNRYFGLMRFSWQILTAAFFFVCGLVIGKNPEIWMLQIIILVTALGILGRIFHDSRLPKDSAPRESLDFKGGMLEAIANKPLSGFSVYICFLYLAANSTVPLTFLYLKKSMVVPDNIIVLISSVVLVGMLIGFLMSGQVIERFGVKRVLLGVHFTFAAINFGLVFIGGNSAPLLIVLSALLVFFGFCYACSSIAISTEMMALVSPHNKTLSMAFCGTFLAAGMGGSRLFTSLILGSGLLAPVWHIGWMRITHYQTLFLAYGGFIMFVCLLLVLVPAIFLKTNVAVPKVFET